MKKAIFTVVFSAFLLGQSLELFPFFHQYELLSPYGTYGVFLFQDEQNYYLNGLQLPLAVFDLFPYLPPPSSLEFDPSELKINFTLPQRDLHLFSISSKLDFKAGIIRNFGKKYVNGWAESYNGIKGRENHLSLFLADAPGSSWSSALYLNLNLSYPQHHPQHRRYSALLTAEKRIKTRSSFLVLHGDLLYSGESPLNEAYRVNIDEGVEEKAEHKKLFWSSLSARLESRLSSSGLYGGVEGRLRTVYYRYSWQDDEKIYLFSGKPYYKISYRGFTESSYVLDAKSYLLLKLKNLKIKAGGFAETGSGNFWSVSPFAKIYYKGKAGPALVKAVLSYDPLPTRALAIAPLRRKDNSFKHYLYVSNGWQLQREVAPLSYQREKISTARRKVALIEAEFPLMKEKAEVNLSLGAAMVDERGFVEDKGLWEKEEETRFLFENEEFKVYRTEGLQGYSIESFDELQRRFYGGFLALRGEIKRFSFYTYISFTRAEGNYDSCLYVPFQEDSYIGFGRSFLMNHPVYDPAKVENLSGDLSSGNGWKAFLLLNYSGQYLNLSLYAAVFPNAPENHFVELLGLAPQLLYYPVRRGSYRESERNFLGGGLLKFKLQSGYLCFGVETLLKSRQLMDVFLGEEEISVIEGEKARVYLAVTREF